MAAAATADLEESLERGTRRGQTLLDKLQFAEARSVYGHVLQLCSPGGATAGTCRQRAMVAAVGGLAESFARQSRAAPPTSDNDQHVDALPAWLRLNIQVVSLID